MARAMRLPVNWRSIRDGGFGGSIDWSASETVFVWVRLRRVVAYLFDMLVVGGLLFLWCFFGGAVALLSFGLALPLVVAAGALLPLLYHTVLLGTAGNATLGMRAMGLTMLREDGGAPGLLQAFCQTVLFYLSVSVTNGLVLLVSLFHPQKRCLHDIVCGTYVVDVAVRTVPGAAAIESRESSTRA